MSSHILTQIKKVFFFFIFSLLLFSLIKNVFDYQKTLHFFEGFKKDYEKEKKNNIALKTRILKNSDPVEVEETIRNKLNLSKDGEWAVIIPEPTPTPTVITPTPLPIYKQWLKTFF
jgi:cell division protein FtsB